MLLQNEGLVYEYVHALMPVKKKRFSRDIWLKERPRSRISKLLTPMFIDRSPPSVIFIILDSVSNLQARRALPQTLAYLKSKGLIVFQHHATVGEGTFDNMAPTFFGQDGDTVGTPNENDSRYKFVTHEWEINPKTKKRVKVTKISYYPGPYDNSSFIMRNFSQLNYTTFFNEEWRDSTFNSLQNGFRQAPADYYLRPYWLSLYETMAYNKHAGYRSSKPCYLNKLLHRLSFDWLVQFLNVYHDPKFNQPTFGILLMNEMSHDYLERLFWIDFDVKEYFEDLLNRGLFNNTILIFCGDHGSRLHPIRLTRIGSFEAKLPFFSMLLPDWFKQSFPKVSSNLMKNSEGKYTEYDLRNLWGLVLKSATAQEINAVLAL